MFVSSPGLSLFLGKLPWELQVTVKSLGSNSNTNAAVFAHPSLLQCSVGVHVLNTYIFLGCLQSVLH